MIVDSENFKKPPKKYRADDPSTYPSNRDQKQKLSTWDLIVDNAKTFKVAWKDNTGHKPNFDTISVKGVYTKTQWEITKNE